MKDHGLEVDRPLQPVELQISQDVKELSDPDAYPIKVSTPVGSAVLASAFRLF